MARPAVVVGELGWRCGAAATAGGGRSGGVVMVGGLGRRCGAAATAGGGGAGCGGCGVFFIFIPKLFAEFHLNTWQTLCCVPDRSHTLEELFADVCMP